MTKKMTPSLICCIIFNIFYALNEKTLSRSGTFQSCEYPANTEGGNVQSAAQTFMTVGGES